ncbi:ankyrin repeat domain-containing protein [candidate division KSB1 bacterium]
MKKIFLIPFIVLVLSVLVSQSYAQDIFNAIRQGNIESVKNMIESDPELLNANDGNYDPLFVATRLRKTEIAEYLISKGADVNKIAADTSAFSPLEWTPVTEAIRTNNFELVKFFIDKGADMKVTTSLGESYLHFAVGMDRRELVGYLIDNGMDVNIVKNGNLTPLHIAVVTGLKDIAELLINKGADLSIKSTDGGTPLHYAVAAGNNEIADILRSHGAADIPREFSVYRGAYLGAENPGMKAEPFAPELFLNIYRAHSNPAFSPDGKELYWECIFIQGNNDIPRVWFMKEENGKWTAPRVAPFAEYPSGGPAFYHDGNKLVYHSMRPRDNSNTPAKDLDFWYVERNGEGWSEPVNLGEEVNKDNSFEVFAVLAGDGTIYWNKGRQGLAKSVLRDGKYTQPEIIGDLFDTDYIDNCKAIDHIIIQSYIRKGPFNHELFISFHQPDGKWSKPVFMGDNIHQGKRANIGRVTIDGKHLFFMRNFSFYWIDAKIIEDLKSNNIKK